MEQKWNEIGTKFSAPISDSNIVDYSEHTDFTLHSTLTESTLTKVARVHRDALCSQ